MAIRLAAAAAALVFATAAAAAETLPLGQPSEPTVYGHAAARTDVPDFAEIDLRREVPAVVAPKRFGPSEPTIWGHQPATPR